MKLRRTTFAWLTDGGFCFPIALIVTVGAVASPHPAAVLPMLAAYAVSLAPTLLGAELVADHLVFGYRWNRRSIEIDSIVSVSIGVVEGFGPHGANVNGMIVLDRDGTEWLVRESQYVRLGRLEDWSREMQSRNGAIVLRRQLITVPR